MTNLNAEYVVDEAGQKKAVLLPYSQWKKVVEDLEELEDIRQYDKAKMMKSSPVRFDKAIEEIEQGLSR